MQRNEQKTFSAFETVFHTHLKQNNLIISKSFYGIELEEMSSFWRQICLDVKYISTEK